MARKSGSMEGQSRAHFKVRLKSAKNLCLGHRFFDEIRQIHRFFDIFRQILQILLRNQARSKLGAEQKLSTSVFKQVINWHANSFFNCWFSPQSDSLKRFIWRETHRPEL